MADETGNITVAGGGEAFGLAAVRALGALINTLAMQGVLDKTLFEINKSVTLEMIASDTALLPSRIDRDLVQMLANYCLTINTDPDGGGMKPPRFGVIIGGKAD